MKRCIPIVLAWIVVVSGIGIAPSATAQDEQVPPWRIPMPQARSTAEIVVGDTPVTVDLALTSDEQSLGLGYRNGLEPGTGMLFVFQQPAERTFWMKGMRFCLDIIWIANDAILGAAENACPDPNGTADSDRALFSSLEPVTHVLEMPAGWLAENNYGRGTPVMNLDALE